MSESDNLPTIIGRYEIKRLLGSGAMGSVFLAEDPRIKRKLAIKVVKMDAIKSEADRKEYLARFQREAEVSGVLNDPGIVTIYDVGDSDLGPFLAMEFVDGNPLDGVIKSGELPHLPLKSKLQIVCGIASALDHAHSHGIVHRDVKPGNVMITQDGRPKLMDFGIAKREDASLTQTGTFLGTPSYASPEQIKDGHATTLSDVFSFGVVVFELLSGQLPFPGTSINTILYRIVNEAPADIRPPVSGLLPEAWQRVFNRVLAKDPKERYASCFLFVKDLLESATELDSNTRTELQGMLRQITGALSLTAVSVGAQDETRISAHMQTRGSRGPLFAIGAAAAIVLIAGGLFLFRKGGGESVAIPQGVSTVLQNGKLLDKNKPLLMKPGEHVVFQAKGFEPFEYVHQAGDRTPKIALEPVIREVELKTDPPGAKVVLNTLEKGVTPLKVKWNEGQTNRLDFFNAEEKKSLSVDFQVGESPKAVDIFVLLPSDAQQTSGVPTTLDASAPVPVKFAGEFAVHVKVDGKDMPGEVRQIELPPGKTCKLELSNRQFFFRDIRQITPTPGKPMTVPLPGLARLTVETFPGGGTVIIDGTPTAAESDGGTPVRVAKGRHTVTIQGKSGSSAVDVKQDSQSLKFRVN